MSLGFQYPNLNNRAYLSVECFLAYFCIGKFYINVPKLHTTFLNNIMFMVHATAYKVTVRYQIY